jgi:hypothetical protein
MSVAAIRDESAFEARLNAVIIYDDRDVAAKAKAALDRAVERADRALTWSVELWRLDMLNLPPTADAALVEASAAHLVVLGVRQSRLLPVWLWEWLEEWALRRQVPDAALALFHGAAAGAGTPTPALAEFAERHGLSYIFGGSSANEADSGAFVRSLRERETSVTPTLRHLLDEPARDFYRHGGINE